MARQRLLGRCNEALDLILPKEGIVSSLAIQQPDLNQVDSKIGSVNAGACLVFTELKFVILMACDNVSCRTY